MKNSFLLFLFTLISCNESKNFRAWNKINNSHTIRFITTNSATTYYQAKEEEYEGFELDLANRFARDHNLKIEFIVKDSIEEVLKALFLGEGDIAAAGLTITDKRLKDFSFSPAYIRANQIVTCKDGKKVKKIEELQNYHYFIPEESSYEENFTELKKEKLPNLSWIKVEGASSEEILHKVWKESNLCTLIDSHIHNLHRRYMPELKYIYKFKEKDKIAWAINNKNSSLLNKINKWFNQKKTQKFVKDKKRQYFEFIEFDPYNLKTFISRIEKRLPKYKSLFIEAADQYNLPWELLAAVGYQESYWDPTAKSPTGVQGLMMITKRTAKELGVKNRKDPKESIFGGAKYIRKIINRLPEYLHPDDKIWFALASYNVGYYHLRDALALSIWQNKNPTRWHSVKEVLPLLAHKKYYRKLPYGHARGLEPVIYVNRIKDFYDILKKREARVAPVQIFN